VPDMAGLAAADVLIVWQARPLKILNIYFLLMFVKKSKYICFAIGRDAIRKTDYNLPESRKYFMGPDGLQVTR